MGTVPAVRPGADPRRPRRKSDGDFEAEDDELAVTLFFSNETEKDVRITSLDSLALTCESGVVADVSANLDMELKSGQFMYQTVLIPPEYLSVSTFADANVSAFAFSVEE